MRNRNLAMLLAIVYLLSNGCSSTKYLQKGEYLVAGNSINIIQKENVKGNKSKVQEDLLSIANPKPNSGFFNIPLKIYGWTKDRKEKGFKNWLFKKYAEEPSIYDENKVEISRLKMNKYLLDHGYIGSQVSVDTTSKKRYMSIQYNIDAHKRHTIQKITEISDTTKIGRYLLEINRRSYLKVGEFYSKENIDAERVRLANELRNRGYINTSENNFYFTVDTQFIDNVVDISVHYKLPKAQDTLLQFQLGNTYIHTITKETKLENFEPDTIMIKPGLYDIHAYEILRPKVLDLSIDQDSSDHISIEQQQLTINHFLSYGLFKYVNQKYSDPYGDSLNIIDRNIYLTPGPDASVGIEFEVNNRSGNFVGAAVNGSFSNNNAFKGAEVFSAGLSLGSEVQINNNQSLLNTLIADIKVGLDIPRLLLPILYKSPSTFYIPHTKINFSNLFENRAATYTALRSSFELTYQWRETQKTNYAFSPVSISYLNLLSTSTAFDETLLSDRRLSLSLQNIFDVGVEISYTFTNQSATRVENYSYLNISARTSGNLLNALINEENDLGQKILFDTPFSQYSKLKFDYRFHVPFRKSMLIARINTGIAYAYGNADEVPYNEQFVVGGSQSLRGFNFRGLGPGSFVLDETLNDPNDVDNVITNQFYDQTGDIILEMNLEYRFPMVGFIKGAVFIDAGNVWLVNKNPQKPGGLFQSNTFINQIALNTGYGFRFDFDIILLRLDLGFVLRGPYFGEGFDWTTNRSDAFTEPWVKENLNYQIGIGYPF